MKTVVPHADVLPAPLQITCGSTIKLQHSGTNRLLHSHEISYGTGSGQQSVTGFEAGNDGNSYWVIRGPQVGRNPAAGLIFFKYVQQHAFYSGFTSVTTVLICNIIITICYYPASIII